MPSSCQKPEPEHCERRTKRKRNQQELDFERRDDNAYVYTSLEGTMPVQFTEVRDKIGVDISPHAMLASAIERIEPIHMATSNGLVYGNATGLSLINSFESLRRLKR
jgi:hypothetical protein